MRHSGMNRRLLLAVAALAVLTISAGCAGPLGSGGENLQQRLAESADYDWNTTRDVTVDVRSGEYTAIYAVENRSKLELYDYDSFGGEVPLKVSAVKFRYPNGTVVGHEQIDVTEKKHKTVVALPAQDGKLAYTAPAGGKTFNLPVFVEGTYQVTLPEGMRVGVFLLSDVRPRGYEATVEDGRTTIVWNEEITANSVVIRYYLARDLTIFGGIVGVLSVVALIGLAYFIHQIRRLEERREEIGLNVDTSDDSGGRKRPPFR